MTQVLAWSDGDDSFSVVRQAAQALAEGQVVAFPTETVYGLAASAVSTEGVERLVQSKGRPESKPLTLAIKGSADIVDWVPGISELGKRLSRKCWPGPVTLVFDGTEKGLLSSLPERVRTRVCAAGTVGIRVPAHPAILEVLRVMAGPLVLTSANASGAEPATTAAQVDRSLGDGVSLIVDGGPSHYGLASTVVRVRAKGLEILREGVVSAAALKQVSACVIVFVCTGNTCRSPLAEGLCKKLLAERLRCGVDDLPERGFIVLSAGVAAMMGGKAAEEAIDVAKEMGADLSGHGSQPLTPDLVRQADYLITMTRSHWQAVAGQFAGLGGVAPRLLCADGRDIADPIGCERSVYRACAGEITRNLEELLPELLRP